MGLQVVGKQGNKGERGRKGEPGKNYNGSFVGGAKGVIQVSKLGYEHFYQMDLGCLGH